MPLPRRLPTFEAFQTTRIQESGDVSALIAAVNDNKRKYRESTRVPHTYQLFKPQTLADRGLRNKLCYSNSLERAQQDDSVQLCIGLLVAKKPNSAGYIETTPHAWNADRATGRVIDLTLGKHTTDHYLGRAVTHSEFIHLSDGGDVQGLVFAETRPEDSDD